MTERDELGRRLLPCYGYPRLGVADSFLLAGTLHDTAKRRRHFQRLGNLSFLGKLATELSAGLKVSKLASNQIGICFRGQRHILMSDFIQLNFMPEILCPEQSRPTTSAGPINRLTRYQNLEDPCWLYTAFNCHMVILHLVQKQKVGFGGRR